MLTSSPAEVFISYSYKDEKLFKQFEKYLSVLEEGWKIRHWHGRMILAGDKWEEIIDEHLKSAHLVLLLVSVDFLASKYCYGVEFKRAMERRAKKATRVIAIILRPCPWRFTPIRNLQVLPRNGTPVVHWKNIDDAFMSVAEGIGEVVESFTSSEDDHPDHPPDAPVPTGPAARRRTLIEFFKSVICAVPAVKYALLLAAIATGVVVVAGLSSNYKIAGLGIPTMFLLMFCLILFSRSVRDSAPPTRTTALALTWLFIGLTVITSVCIITGFFISWPQPLEAYLYFSKPTPGVQITITEVPPNNPVGGREQKGRIAGKVSGLKTNDYFVVIYSFTLTWYVQPTTANPKTKIKPDGTWEAEIQLGSKYAAVVVPPNYNPPYTMTSRPAHLSGITAAAEVDGSDKPRTIGEPK
jgi:hypothetical protein